jgi:hypothetical protein
MQSTIFFQLNPTDKEVFKLRIQLFWGCFAFRFDNVAWSDPKGIHSDPKEIHCFPGQQNCWFEIDENPRKLPALFSF